MSRHRAAFAIAALTVLAAPAGFAQEREASPLSAEEMIEVAREAYRPQGLLRRCSAGAPGEIVVCASDPDEFRVPSSTDEAIEAGEAVADGIPRAPDLFGIPPGGVTVARGCFVPPCPPPMPPLIDLEAIPEPLTPEEARHVFRAQDASSPTEASPAELP